MKKNSAEKENKACYVIEEDLDSIIINFYRSEITYINDAVDKLVVKLHNYKKIKNKRTVLLTGCGSANGTSMIAINLAIALSLAGWKTLLVDADFRKSQKYKRVGSKTEKGLSNYLDNQANVNDVIYKTNNPNLEYVPCGTSESNAVLLLCSENMTRFITDRGNEYEFVIIDTPSVTVVPDASVLFLAVDGIALVASLNETTKKQLSTAKREVEKSSDKYYGLIINKVDKKQYNKFFPQQGYFRDYVLYKNALSKKKKNKRLNNEKNI